MDVAYCQKQHNLQRALEFTGTCDADMVVFPEVFSTGFCYDHIDEIAESEPYPTIEMLKLRVHTKRYILLVKKRITSQPANPLSLSGPHRDR